MAKKLRTHFVPRLLIRQFCNLKGKVFCFDKQQVRVPDRKIGNGPKDILHRKEFYVDPTRNLDPMFSEVESAFAPHLQRFMIDSSSAKDDPNFKETFTSWVAAQMVRTELIPTTVRHLLEKGGSDVLANPDLLATLVNNCRLSHYFHLTTVMNLPKWDWSLVKAKGHPFVLGDHPVCNTTTSMRP